MIIFLHFPSIFAHFSPLKVVSLQYNINIKTYSFFITMNRKWLSELKAGEVFTLSSDVDNFSTYFVALGTFQSSSIKGTRKVRPFTSTNTILTLANQQVYSCGIIVNNL